MAIEQDFLVLTDADGGALMVKQKGEYRRKVTQQPQAVLSNRSVCEGRIGRE